MYFGVKKAFLILTFTHRVPEKLLISSRFCPITVFTVRPAANSIFLDQIFEIRIKGERQTYTSIVISTQIRSFNCMLFTISRVQSHYQIHVQDLGTEHVSFPRISTPIFIPFRSQTLENCRRLLTFVFSLFFFFLKTSLSLSHMYRNRIPLMRAKKRNSIFEKIKKDISKIFLRNWLTIFTCQGD